MQGPERALEARDDDRRRSLEARRASLSRRAGAGLPWQDRTHFWSSEIDVEFEGRRSTGW